MSHPALRKVLASSVGMAFCGEPLSGQTVDYLIPDEHAALLWCEGKPAAVTDFWHVAYLVLPGVLPGLRIAFPACRTGGMASYEERGAVFAGVTRCRVCVLNRGAPAPRCRMQARVSQSLPGQSLDFIEHRVSQSVDIDQLARACAPRGEFSVGVIALRKVEIILAASAARISVDAVGGFGHRVVLSIL